jgi:hypothetical protein
MARPPSRSCTLPAVTSTHEQQACSDSDELPMAASQALAGGVAREFVAHGVRTTQLLHVDDLRL